VGDWIEGGNTVLAFFPVVAINQICPLSTAKIKNILKSTPLNF
jgi:hypothetical protein